MSVRITKHDYPPPLDLDDREFMRDLLDEIEEVYPVNDHRPPRTRDKIADAIVNLGADVAGVFFDLAEAVRGDGR
jgi:hypothetical protein